MDKNREAFEKWVKEMLPQCDNIDDAILQRGIAVTAWQAATQAVLAGLVEEMEGLKWGNTGSFAHGHADRGIRKCIALLRKRMEK